MSINIFFHSIFYHENPLHKIQLNYVQVTILPEGPARCIRFIRYSQAYTNILRIIRRNNQWSARERFEVSYVSLELISTSGFVHGITCTLFGI